MANFRLLQRNEVGVSVSDAISYNSVNREYNRLLSNDYILCANKASVASTGIDYSQAIGVDKTTTNSYPSTYVDAGIYNELKVPEKINLITSDNEVPVVTYKPLNGTVKQYAYSENGLWFRKQLTSTNWSEWQPFSIGNAIGTGTGSGGNADLLCGYEPSVKSKNNAILVRDGNGNIDMSWVSAVTYNSNAMVSYDGKLYKSKVSQNTNNNPLTGDRTKWSSIQGNLIDVYTITGNIDQQISEQYAGYAINVSLNSISSGIGTVYLPMLSKVSQGSGFWIYNTNATNALKIYHSSSDSITNPTNTDASGGYILLYPYESIYIIAGNTSWFRSVIPSRNDVINLSESTQLTSYHSNRVFGVGNPSNFTPITLTLPMASSSRGLEFEFFIWKDITVTLKVHANDTNTSLILGNFNSQSNTITLKYGDKVRLVGDSLNWIIMSGNYGLTTALKAANGWQKLDSGIIIQWGTGWSDANGNSNLQFPISFTTTDYSINGIHVGSGAAGVIEVYQTRTPSNVKLRVFDANGATGIWLFNWIAIGY